MITVMGKSYQFELVGINVADMTLGLGNIYEAVVNVSREIEANPRGTFEVPANLWPRVCAEATRIKREKAKTEEAKAERAKLEAGRLQTHAARKANARRNGNGKNLVEVKAEAEEQGEQVRLMLQGMTTEARKVIKDLPAERKKFVLQIAQQYKLPRQEAGVMTHILVSQSALSALLCLTDATNGGDRERKARDNACTILKAAQRKRAA